MDATERRDRAAEEAAEWMLRLESEDMTRSERTQYVQWLRESPLHVAEMLRVGQVHKRLAEFPDWKAMPATEASELSASVLELQAVAAPAAREAQPHPRRLWPWVSAVTAAIAVVAVTTTYFLLVPSSTIVADAGTPKEARLPDGSLVQLSPRSTLRLHFTARERDVVLSNGDALFKVAKDPAKPFIVHAGHTRVRAVGTVFGVEHDDEAVIVTVQEGRVSVLDSIGKPATLTLQPIPVTEISLGANQQIIVPPAGPMGGVRKVDSRRELAWAQGRLIFDNDSVAEVVRRFNRFNRMQMKVLDPTLATRPVSAVFDARDPEAFIIFLESVANVRITRASADEILITSEGPR